MDLRNGAYIRVQYTVAPKLSPRARWPTKSVYVCVRGLEFQLVRALSLQRAAKVSSAQVPRLYARGASVGVSESAGAYIHPLILSGSAALAAGARKNRLIGLPKIWDWWALP